MSFHRAPWFAESNNDSNSFFPHVNVHVNCQPGRVFLEGRLSFWLFFKAKGRTEFWGPLQIIAPPAAEKKAIPAVPGVSLGAGASFWCPAHSGGQTGPWSRGRCSRFFFWHSTRERKRGKASSPRLEKCSWLFWGFCSVLVQGGGGATATTKGFCKPYHRL